jgi:hypothetical protein
LVGKNGLPAKRLTGKVVFPNSTESKVRVSWFGRREEWKVVSQVVFGEEVTETEKNKKMPERLTWDRQQETTVGELLKERSEAEEQEKAKAKEMEKRIVNISKELTISLILRKLLKLLSWGQMRQRSLTLRK